MPAKSINIETRIKALNCVVEPAHQEMVTQTLQEARCDLTALSAAQKDSLPSGTLQRLHVADSIATAVGDDSIVVTAISDHPEVKNAKSLREVVLSCNVDKVTAMLAPEAEPDPEAYQKARNDAAAINREWFIREPSATVQRMVQESEIPIANAVARDGVVNILKRQPDDFNIRTTSVYTALKNPDALKDVPEEHLPDVIEQLKRLFLATQLAPQPESIQVLMKYKMTSQSISDMPYGAFLRKHVGELGKKVAGQIYTQAMNTNIRNVQVGITVLDVARENVAAIMKSKHPIEKREALAKSIVKKHAPQLNLETLFGSMDYCECRECQSVYSPAAYFVELLQLLRNNNLGPDPATGYPDPKLNKKIHPGIVGTPLEMLFRRRPDLGCLELTCENTNTVLPYIDLANEIMESFVAHYHDADMPDQLQLETFNVEDETSGELLAQPQHVNYQAYCILKRAVYPFTLPYHQPIDATRIFLKHLGTSRYELLDTYRTATETCENVVLSPADRKDLQDLHKRVQDRACDAEFLGLTQEEYIILTKEAFWPRRYFKITQPKEVKEKDYHARIGVKSVWEYYGYSSDADMLSIEEVKQLGLTFVKKQFLPRTGIQYADLVELLKTRFVNPNHPQGEALRILESIRFSYRFLQTLVDANSTDPQVRFGKLIAFLEWAGPFLPLLDAWLHPDPCRLHKTDGSLEIKNLRNWVYCYFERIGKLIVLEAGEKPQLPIEGKLFKYHDTNSIGTLFKDGTIVDLNGTTIGNVQFDMTIVWKDNKSLQEMFGVGQLLVYNGNDRIGSIFDSGLRKNNRMELFSWLPPQDTCNLDKVRLIHLDGTPLTVDEYDRMQRFIRIWRKMGWTIDETDKALIGLSHKPSKENSIQPGQCEYVDFETFEDDCRCDCAAGPGDDWDCPDIIDVDYDITPDFLHQLVAVRKLLDLTGLPLLKLLTFWADISTAGEKSLYLRLFLTHNLLGIDKVFQPDKHGLYLTQQARISDHVPVLMAALKLKADDITTIGNLLKLTPPLSLSLANVSELYRHSLLAKSLHVKVSDLPNVIALFGDPFQDAHKTLALFETWGKMEDAGFTFRQLNYLIRDPDEMLHPLAPAKKTVLQIAKTLYDGLNKIDREHPDIPQDKKGEATTDLVRTKAGLLFEPSVVERIIALLEGTTVYTTNAPANQTITIPDSLSKKLKYCTQKDANPPQATIQVTGILTEAECNAATKLCDDPGWEKAFERIGKQKQNVFNDSLSGIFPDQSDAKAKLLAGDVNIPIGDQAVAPSDQNTAPAKRFYFLQHFLPVLRQQLSHRFVVDTLSGAAGLATDVTNVLLTYVLKGGAPPEYAVCALEKIQEKSDDSASGWKGYLIPSADGDYAFIAVGDSKPASLKIDGQTLEFPYQQDDPSNVWSTDPVSKLPIGKLKKGQLYLLEVTDRRADQLQWKTASSSKVKIPSSALLPDYSTQGTEDVFIKLYKAALLVNGFNLSADEINYWQVHGKGDFGGFDFNGMTLPDWLRLQAYTNLRDSLPKGEKTLIDLFGWAAGQPADSGTLSDRIAAVTGWKKERVSSLVAPRHFDLNHPEAFRNEVQLVSLQKALRVADKIGMDIDRLFDWAKPTSKYWDCHQIAEDIRMAVHSRYNQEDWEQVVKPLNDQLRENQKQALINYLLVQKDLIEWGVVDADSLFEFFLIDVQMTALRETSRIKQAISSVQLFIQRCLLGLEEQYGLPNSAVDRERWAWMQKYRVWEANRKVFLYPENWIRPELRDDKSPFYKELESELLQKDINTQTVQDALKNYLFKVDEAANLKVEGLFIEQKFDKDGNPVFKDAGKTQSLYIKLHIFARTRNAPYFFFYRYFDIGEKNWYPWEKMQVDIPSYDAEAVDDAGQKTGKIKENGTYLIPVIWNNRLLVFFPQFMKKTKANDVGDNITTSQDEDGNSQIPVSKPLDFWEIKMAWSEYRNGKWTQKQVSTAAVYDIDPDQATFGPDISSYVFIPLITKDKVSIEVLYKKEPIPVPKVNEEPVLNAVSLHIRTTDDDKDSDIGYDVSVKDKDGIEFAYLRDEGRNKTYHDWSDQYLEHFILNKKPTKSKCRGFYVDIIDNGQQDGWHFNAELKLAFNDGSYLIAYKEKLVLERKNDVVKLFQQ